MNFYIIYHFLRLRVFMTIQNIGWNIPLRTLSFTLQLNYNKERYLNQLLENYRFCRNSGNDAYRGGGGIILFLSF